MADSFRCPSCGALNAQTAEWCGQCLYAFRRTPPPPPPISASTGTATDVEPAAPSSLTPTRRGAFAVTDSGITWQCTRCETENPIAASMCNGCGISFAESMRPKEDRPQRDPNDVALYSLLLPGVGHWMLNQRGQAIGRAILSVWVVMIALFGFVTRTMTIAIPFAVVAFVLWGLSAHDAYREANGEPGQVVLKGRTFMFSVLGLLGLLTLLFITEAMKAL